MAEPADQITPTELVEGEDAAEEFDDELLEPDPAARPTVICDDVHVVYKIVASGGAGSAAAAVRRMIKGERKEKLVKSVHAVKGVTFVAREGDAIGLIGKNGSGKSTLLRAVAGLLPAEKGAVYTTGRPSLLGVNAALMRDLTGEQNVMLGCMAMGMSKEEAAAKHDWIVDFAGLGEFINLPMTAYSSGMAARLRFAIAASVTHDILMIDEALATGDAEFRRRSEARIKELRRQAGTVFLVSHSLGTVRETCNRALWLEGGQLLMDGPTSEVISAYEAVYDPDIDARARLRAKRRRRRAAREAAIAREAATAALSAVAAAQQTDTAQLAAVVADHLDLDRPVELPSVPGMSAEEQIEADRKARERQARRLTQPPGNGASGESEETGSTPPQ